MSITRRIDKAREAFEKKDLAASGAAHDPEAIAQAIEQHGGASHQYIGDMVYGGLDGIVTTFAVVSGVAGAALGSSVAEFRRKRLKSLLRIASWTPVTVNWANSQQAFMSYVSPFAPIAPFRGFRDPDPPAIHLRALDCDPARAQRTSKPCPHLPPLTASLVRGRQ
jgi:hypothetical protein